jgi:Flp pilus assembly pilin Flp
MQNSFVRQKSHVKRKSFGQGMTEYLIITALIAVAAIATFAFFGKTIRNQMSGLSNQVAGQPSTQDLKNAKASAVAARTAANKDKNLSQYNNAIIGQ